VQNRSVPSLYQSGCSWWPIWMPDEPGKSPVECRVGRAGWRGARIFG